MSSIIQFAPLILIFVLMYFILIRPQRKKEKEVTSMRNRIGVGDEVITIGGICGKIVKTKDDSLVIQVGSDKTKFEIMRWAVSKVVSSKNSGSNEKGFEPTAEEEAKPSKPKRLKKKEAPTEENVDNANKVSEEVAPEEVASDEAATDEK